MDDFTIIFLFMESYNILSKGYYKFTRNDNNRRTYALLSIILFHR